MGWWLFLAGLVAGCSGDPGSPSDTNHGDSAGPIVDDSATDDSGTHVTKPPGKLPTTWAACNWAQVPSSPFTSLWVGHETTWFGAQQAVYTIDLPTHTLLKDT